MTKIRKAYADLADGQLVGVRLAVHGDTWGTLCFLGTHPRPAPFTAHDLEILQVLAEQVERSLESRFSEAAYRAARGYAAERVQFGAPIITNQGVEIRQIASLQSSYSAISFSRYTFRIDGLSYARYLCHSSWLTLYRISPVTYPPDLPSRPQNTVLFVVGLALENPR